MREVVIIREAICIVCAHRAVDVMIVLNLIVESEKLWMLEFRLILLKVWESTVILLCN